MKLTINAEVRKTMEELRQHFERYDAIVGVLSDKATSNSRAMDAGIDKASLETAIIGTAARLLSHATRGKLYPLMTEKFYGRTPR